jgi:predicted peptidase
LILILHGAGERGNNNTSQLYDFLVVFQRDSIRKKYPAIVVLPQCPANQGFQYLPLSGVIVSLQEKFAIDKNRMYVGGLSVGGHNTYDIVVKNPDTFAAAFPICAWWDDMTAVSQMTTPDWWLFHGDKDTSVSVADSYKMSQALKDAGAKEVKLTIYPGVGHNSWDRAFAEPDLIPWLFSKSLDDKTSLKSISLPNVMAYSVDNKIYISGNFTTATLYNMEGKFIKQFEPGQNHCEVSRGIYVVKVVKGDESKVIKLIVN